MDDTNKNRAGVVIPFPVKLRQSVSQEDDPDDFNGWGDDFFEFDDWEKDYELLQNKDYNTLLKVRKKRLKTFPDNEFAQYYLAEAYILNKEYLRALHYLSDLHKDQPERIDLQYLVIDALAAIGKTENDFHWIKKPVVIDLTEDLIDNCYRFLETKRKPRTIDEIYSRFICDGYIRFSREDLLNRIGEDARFIIDNPEDPYFAFISVSKI